MELGLLIFMAGVGLRAGSGLLDTLATSGLSLFVAGILVTLVPVLVGFSFGRWVLRPNPVMLLGAITGSMTSGAALAIVNREAGKLASVARLHERVRLCKRAAHRGG